MNAGCIVHKTALLCLYSRTLSWTKLLLLTCYRGMCWYCFVLMCFYLYPKKDLREYILKNLRDISHVWLVVICLWFRKDCRKALLEKDTCTNKHIQNSLHGQNISLTTRYFVQVFLNNCDSKYFSECKEIRDKTS